MTPSSTMASQRAALATLAARWGIQSSYRDYRGRMCRAPAASLLAILAALGAPVAQLSDAQDGLLLRRRQEWQQVLQPVVVAWDGRLRSLDLRLPAAAASGRLSLTVTLEGGQRDTAKIDLQQGRVREQAEVDGTAFVALRVPMAQRFPPGYHRLALDAGNGRHDTLVIAAPRHAWVPPAPVVDPGSGGEAVGSAARMWGVFAPVHALHSEHSLGVGDFRDLATLRAWVGGLGGDFVGTLPMLATFLDELFEPSPYSPISRRFWNEIFIDVTAVPEVAASPAAQAALQDARGLLGEGTSLGLVDYPAVAAAKRRILAAAAEHLWDGDSPRRGELDAYRAGHPDLDRYAAFRAAGEAFRTPWQQWPEPARAGDLSGAGNEEARRYHRYVQFVAGEQAAAADASAGPQLLLDLPLGVHPAGYDVWADREAFVLGTSAGAPPDPLNAAGQNWGNPPLHPDGIRDSGYAYPIACIRHLLACSSILRVDHVMGLHRLFVIPTGAEGRDGAYLRYRAEEGYAILSLESHRGQALVVGEDLGTVPTYVRREMATHWVHRCHVAQWAIPREPQQGMVPVPVDVVASINTHDMAPYAAFWRGEDIAERTRLGLIGAEEAGREEWHRGEDRSRLIGALQTEGLLAQGATGESDVLDAWLAWLAHSPARAMMVSLEDLWGETASQNIPGTVAEHPNWRRRMACSLEEMASAPQVVGRLKMIDAWRAAPADRPTRTEVPH